MKPREHSTNPFVIALASEKGGVGKTTLAVNLAGVFALRGLGVILIDEDPIASATLWGRLGIRLGMPLPFPVYGGPWVPREVVAASRWVVLDTPAQATAKQVSRLLEVAHRVVIPAGFSNLDALPVMHLWERVRGQPGAEKIRVVVTKAPPTGKLGAQIRSALEGRCIPVTQTIIRAYAAHQKAAEYGCLADDVTDPRAAAAWGDVVQLAAELAEGVTL